MFDYMILYTSTDGNIVHPNTIVGFNQNIKSNTYTNIGKITFWGPFSIGSSVFHDCDTLKTIIIPNSIATIGVDAFSDCDNLTSIEIPNSVTNIGDYAFNGCISLTSIVVDAGNSKYDSRNGCNAIIETASNTLIAGCQNTIIPNSVTSIGYSAFRSCTSLTSIEIPNSVTSIGDSAFYQCGGLTSIEIPNSVTSIGHSAFRSCSGLTSVYIKSTTPPTLVDYVFYYNASNRKIYVPRASLNTYKTASGWSKYADAIEPYDF